MTFDNVIFLAVGVCVNGLTFALGIAVGLTLRKDSDNDDSDHDEATQAGGNWHLPLDIGTAYRPQLRSAGGSKSQPKADLAKRAPL